MSQNTIPAPTAQKHEISALSTLAELALDYAKLSKSANTRKAYQSDWADFTFWCRSHQLSSLPADPSTISLYLADRVTNPWINHNGKPHSPLVITSDLVGFIRNVLSGLH